MGLNPTGITRGCSCLNCTSFIRRVWHPCHTHAALVSAVSAAPFIYPRCLDTSTFVIRIDRRRCSYRPTQMLVSTDADVRIDRRRCPHRPTQMSVSTDADVRIDRRRRPHRPAQMSASTDADEKTCSFTCIRLRRIVILQAQ